MNKNNPIKAIDKINFTEQTKFRLSERKSHCKKLNKYVTVFDYIDKILIFIF